MQPKRSFLLLLLFLSISASLVCSQSDYKFLSGRPGYDCHPVYVKWPRVRLNFGSSKSGPLELQKCKDACTRNEDPEGNGSAHQCSAFNHKIGLNAYSHECQLFQKDNVQHTDGYVEADDRYSFYWKYCVNEAANRPCFADHHFTFHSDRYMATSEIQTSVYTTSLEDCLAECLNSVERRKGLLCQSVSFNRTDGGCHLSEQNQLSKPAALKINNNPNFRIDYYENECIRKKDSFRFRSSCEPDGVRVDVESRFPYTGAFYGLYDFFSCRVEPKEEKNFGYLFPYPTSSKNCSDSMRYSGNEVILEVVLSTDGVEPLYFITSDDLTYQVKCPLPGSTTSSTSSTDTNSLQPITSSADRASSTATTKKTEERTTSRDEVGQKSARAFAPGSTSAGVPGSSASSSETTYTFTSATTTSHRPPPKSTTKDVFTLPFNPPATTTPGLTTKHSVGGESTSRSATTATTTTTTPQPQLLLLDANVHTGKPALRKASQSHHGLEPIDLSELRFRDTSSTPQQHIVNATASIEEVENFEPRITPIPTSTPTPITTAKLITTTLGRTTTATSSPTSTSTLYPSTTATTTTKELHRDKAYDDKSFRIALSSGGSSRVADGKDNASTTKTSREDGNDNKHRAESTTTTPTTPVPASTPISTTATTTTTSTTTTTTTTTTSQHQKGEQVSVAPDSKTPTNESVRQHYERRTNDAVIFDIFHNGQPAEAVVVGSRITLSFTPYFAIPPSYMSISGCQVEPIGSLYEWEKEPLAIIKDGCQADHVGLVCPPQRTEYGIRVSVEAFRYQTTTQVQYTCLIRICPFAPCPQTTCSAVEGCLGDDLVSRSLGLRAKRHLSVEQIRAALAANPYLQQQLSLTQSTSGNAKMNSSLQGQLISIGGDHIVRRRLIVVNSEDELRYYIKTGEVPQGHL